MRLAGAVEDRFGLSLTVRLPDVLHMQYGEHYPFRVTESNFTAAGGQFFGEIFGHVKSDRNGPENADGQAREWALSSVARSGWVIRSMSSPPWAAIKWLVEAVKRVNLQGSVSF